MKLFNFFKSEKPPEVIEQKEEIQEEPKSSDFLFGEVGGGWYGGGNVPTFAVSFNGEKTPGELGAIIRNIPDYRGLRFRAYDAFTKTDVVKILTSKRIQWVVGVGLKLECEPNKRILEMENITLPSNFQERVEARWSVWSNSKMVDYEKRRNLHELAKDFYADKFKGGDCLCVVRFEDKGMTVQFISGEHVMNPFDDTLKGEGNTIEHGIEINERGEHVAYWVYKKGNDLIGDYERISAVGDKSKMTMAWMIYGQKLAADHKRGVPEFTQILEKVRKLDRYTEATVSKAEQAANILFTIVHDVNAIGDNPLTDMVREKMAKKTGEVIDSYKVADGLANTIKQTTSNQTINLPPGAKLVPHESTSEAQYEEFFRANFNNICASVDTPPEVALQMYNSNYSASRAAINGWGYVIDIDRNDFSNQYYRPIYKLWLIMEILMNKIDAPGFVKALQTNDYMITESYSQARFTGKNMPHIDPLKEIKAIRSMLGDKDFTALISREQAAEMLGVGDWEENIKENEEEITDNNLKSIENVNTTESTISQ